MIPREQASTASVGGAGWITPQKAAALSGRNAEVLVRYLREGLISGERRDGRWYLPRDRFLREIARL